MNGVTLEQTEEADRSPLSLAVTGGQLQLPKLSTRNLVASRES